MNTMSPLRRRRLAGGCAFAAVLLLAAGAAAAAEFSVAPGDRTAGAVQHYVVQPGDNLADIARKFDIGYTEMIAANPGVEPWVPRTGTTLNIPSLYVIPDVPRQGIVINLGERRLYYFPPGGGPMQTYPIGIAAIGFDTPHRTTTVVRKEPNPTWVPTASVRREEPDIPAVIGPGPDNPLGAYALRLGWPNYLIHGTNKPDGVGRNVSHGCIHLYPEDIERLFNSVDIGTPVRVVDQQAAAAWIADRLYVEIHPTKDQADQIDTDHAMVPEPVGGLHRLVSAIAGDDAQAVDWRAVDQAADQRTGLPVAVATHSGGGPTAETDTSSAQPVSLAPLSAADGAEGGANSQSAATQPPPPGAIVQAPDDVAGAINPEGLPPPEADGPYAGPGPYGAMPDDGATGDPAAGDRPGDYNADSDPDRPVWDRAYR